MHCMTETGTHFRWVEWMGSLFVNDFQFSAFNSCFESNSILILVLLFRCYALAAPDLLYLWALVAIFRFIVVCCCLTYTIQHSLALAMLLCVWECTVKQIYRKQRLIINCFVYSIFFNRMWLLCVGWPHSPFSLILTVKSIILLFSFARRACIDKFCFEWLWKFQEITSYVVLLCLP